MSAMRAVGALLTLAGCALTAAALWVIATGGMAAPDAEWLMVYAALCVWLAFLVSLCDTGSSSPTPPDPAHIAALEHECLGPRPREAWGHGPECWVCWPTNSGLMLVREPRLSGRRERR